MYKNNSGFSAKYKVSALKSATILILTDRTHSAKAGSIQ